ncbi:MAG TPA: tRNA(His) guanylyltransferase Thg1 family protein [Armatimonadota bacterium]|nr:tRNA(His) guanylyltransferase Thg1 family protein [Armatimonadota bacterium]
MDPNEFEGRMRSLEYFHSLRLLPHTWAVIRVDGRGFTRFTESRFDRPFDARFHDCMARAAQVLLEEMGGLYAYTESDEISVLFAPEWEFFDRELEKIVSLSAGIASATFTHACGEPAHFDSRVWLGANEVLVVDYFRWRQTDAGRCALNGWCYWTLRKAGMSVGEATAALERQAVSAKHELLFQHGVNFAELPLWQRRGAGVYWETYEKEGYNPKEDRRVVTTRRRVKVDRELPMKEAYDALIRRLMEQRWNR